MHLIINYTFQILVIMKTHHLKKKLYANAIDLLDSTPVSTPCYVLFLIIEALIKALYPILLLYFNA